MRKNDIPETIISYGLVLSMPIDIIPDMKKAIFSFHGVRLVYQKMSIEKLEIVEKPKEVL